MNTIEVKILNKDARVPIQAAPTDAGYDLATVEDFILGPKERHLFRTGIVLAIPEGYYGRIAPRSGLAHKGGIDVLAGVIDSGYRGEVGVILYNTGDVPFTVIKGMRIAQIIIETCHSMNWIVVDELDSSIRGRCGFGSTGV